MVREAAVLVLAAGVGLRVVGFIVVVGLGSVLQHTGGCDTVSLLTVTSSCGQQKFP